MAKTILETETEPEEEEEEEEEEIGEFEEEFPID